MAIRFKLGVYRNCFCLEQCPICTTKRCNIFGYPYPEHPESSWEIATALSFFGEAMTSRTSVIPAAFLFADFQPGIGNSPCKPDKWSINISLWFPMYPYVSPGSLHHCGQSSVLNDSDAAGIPECKPTNQTTLAQRKLHEARAMLFFTKALTSDKYQSSAGII